MNVASAMSFVWDTKPDFPSSHLNTRFLNAELQENLARNKANKMIE